MSFLSLNQIPPIPCAFSLSLSLGAREVSARGGVPRSGRGRAMDSGTWRRVLTGRRARMVARHTIGGWCGGGARRRRLVGWRRWTTAGDGGGGGPGSGAPLEREVGGGRQHAGAGSGLWLYCARRGGTRLRRQRQRRRRRSMMSASCSSTSPSPSSRHHRPAPEMGLGDSGGRGRRVAARLVATACGRRWAGAERGGRGEVAARLGSDGARKGA